eukprot:TRINITY_DN4878_c0_g1_i1.p1 TRINITY_DN4878_c0_g1~~TRINITY_DN4878_c0_g1_i1.p1  ORF type:complete len:100 (+),score=20.77 TRINITY_DN4878_c0_g1_i1:48-347(+)
MGEKCRIHHGFEEGKTLREDILEMILRYEVLDASTGNQEELDELLEAICQHEKFLDEVYPLKLERTDGFREVYDDDEETISDLYPPVSPRSQFCSPGPT